MTCTICGNAHSDECSVAALKARIEWLDRRVGVLNTRERMVLDELGFAEDVSPVWNAVRLNIRDLRERVKEAERERDAALSVLSSVRAAFTEAFYDATDLPTAIRAAGDEYGREEADARGYEEFMGELLTVIGADPKAWDATDEMTKALDVARALVAERDAARKLATANAARKG